MKKFFRIIVVLTIAIIISGCGKSNSIEDCNNYTPVFAGWSNWSGGPEYIFKVSKLIDKNGKDVVNEMCDIERCLDSYGYPMWLCQYYGRHDYITVEMLSNDGTWRHTIFGNNICCYMDENGLFCVDNEHSENSLIIDDKEYILDAGMTYFYNVGNEVVFKKSSLISEKVDNDYCGIWNNDSKTLSYGNSKIKLPSYISYANYKLDNVINNAEGIEKSVYWDGNIYAECDDFKKILFDEFGQKVIIEGSLLDRVEDKGNHKIYYTSIGYDNQLRVYNQEGEYITDLQGRFVTECWDGVFWTVDINEEDISIDTVKECKIYSKSI